MFTSVLVANRGEIAGRILRTARQQGLATVAVHSPVDAELPYVALADRAVALDAVDGYRDVTAILAAARATGAQAIHPGYGFRSEDPEFARAVLDAGLVWIGPHPDTMAVAGDKIAARNLLHAHGLPVAAGTDRGMRSAFEAELAGDAIGYPVLLKAAAGGGGMGLTVVSGHAAMAAGFERTAATAQRLFGDPTVFVEEYFPRVRHVEVQILGLADGSVHALGERECSVQRRHQKLAEETPSPGVDADLRVRLFDAAVTAGRAVDYRGAGTVEFLLIPPEAPGGTAEFVFCELNPRLQVEHPITEAVLGIDLVAAQFAVAAGAAPAFDPTALAPRGHALQLRINAEDPVRFLPAPGLITGWRQPAGDGIRVDAGYAAGSTVTRHYDPLLAKLVVHAPDRPTALDRARSALADFGIDGPRSNLAFHAELLDDPEFRAGSYDTAVVDRMRAAAPTGPTTGAPGPVVAPTRGHG